MHTLTVNGSDLRGKPDTGDVVMVINVDNPIRFSDPIASLNFFFHGQTRFSVPAGHYWAIGDFFNFTATSANERLVVLPQFTVGSAAGAASNTVSVPETAASSLVSAITPRPTSPLLSMLDLRRTGPGGPMTAGWENVGLPLWISPTHHRPSVGTLQVFTDLEQRSPAHTAMPPYEYDVAFAATHGIIPSQRHVVSNAHLATVSEAYYQAVKSNGGFVRFGLFPQQFNDLLLLLINPLSLPRHDTEYYSAAPGLVWYSQYWQSGFNLSGGQSQAPEEYVGGQQLTDNWDAYPLHPAPNVRLRAPAGISTLPSASRQGNTLTLDITPFSDNQPGHLGAGFFSGFGSFPKLSGTYEIDQNGVKIAGGDAVAASGGAPDLLTQVHLDSHPSVIRFVLDATRKGKGNTYPLSTSSQTVWTWHSARDTHSTVPAGWVCGSLLTGSPSRHCVVQPMMTLRYQVAGLSLAGKAKPGSQSLDLFAGHLQAATQAATTSAQVQVSFDDGATWQPASVTPSRRRPLPGDVHSTAIELRDAAGYRPGRGRGRDHRDHPARLPDIGLTRNRDPLMTRGRIFFIPSGFPRPWRARPMGRSLTVAGAMLATAILAAGGTLAAAYPQAAPRHAPAVKAACPVARPRHARCLTLFRPETAVNHAIAARIRGALATPGRMGGHEHRVGLQAAREPGPARGGGRLDRLRHPQPGQLSGHVPDAIRAAPLHRGQRLPARSQPAGQRLPAAVVGGGDRLGPGGDTRRVDDLRCLPALPHPGGGGQQRRHQRPGRHRADRRQARCRGHLQQLRLP